MRQLTCDMHRDCAATVTHVDENGYVYCANHGAVRKMQFRCRKLKPAEAKRLQDGKTIRY